MKNANRVCLCGCVYCGHKLTRAARDPVNDSRDWVKWIRWGLLVWEELGMCCSEWVGSWLLVRCVGVGPGTRLAGATEGFPA